MRQPYEELQGLLEDAVFYEAEAFESSGVIDPEALKRFFETWRVRVKSALGMRCLICGPLCICEPDSAHRVPNKRKAH